MSCYDIYRIPAPSVLRPYEDAKKARGQKRTMDGATLPGVNTLLLGGCGLSQSKSSDPAEGSSKRARVNKNAKHLVS